MKNELDRNKLMWAIVGFGYGNVPWLVLGDFWIALSLIFFSSTIVVAFEMGRKYP